tara:strand:+ start:100 stop:543 length:444 start_codon:yes stop_codon:yes gene_type:complete
MNFDKISDQFCSSFGLGYISKFPGTLASIVILPVVWLIKSSFGLSALLFFIFFFSILSYFFIALSINKKKDKDPSSIIVDEYIGQSIALIYCNEVIFEYLIAFILFRFFDIVKPFPINLLNKIKNAFGVLIDDVVAGIVVCIIFYLY